LAYKVIVPDKNFNDIRCGVKFTKGEAIVEDEKVAKMLAESLGYKVIKEKTNKKTSTKSTKKNDTKKNDTKKSK